MIWYVLLFEITNYNSINTECFTDMGFLLTNQKKNPEK